MNLTLTAVFNANLDLFFFMILDLSFKNIFKKLLMFMRQIISGVITNITFCLEWKNNTSTKRYKRPLLIFISWTYKYFYFLEHLTKWNKFSCSPFYPLGLHSTKLIIMLMCLNMCTKETGCWNFKSNFFYICVLCM